MSTTAYTVTARKTFRCYGVGCNAWVYPGEEYARHVAFPGDGDIGNEGFWVLRICAACHTRYGQSMPSRRVATSDR